MYCNRCCDDVTPATDGRCPWCDKMLKKSPDDPRWLEELEDPEEPDLREIWGRSDASC